MAAAAAALVTLACVCSLVLSAHGEAPYRFFDWNVSYGDINPLGAPQQVASIICAERSYAGLIWHGMCLHAMSLIDVDDVFAFLSRVF
jgi:hypothetical protein